MYVHARVCVCVYIQYVRTYVCTLFFMHAILRVHLLIVMGRPRTEEAYLSTKEVTPTMQTSRGGERWLNPVVDQSVHQILSNVAMN